MKTILYIIFAFVLCTPGQWGGDLDHAKAEAKEQNKLVLLYFSGSDWCPPCMKLRKDVYDSQAFKDYAAKNLILVNADFPRKKKNKLDDAQVKKNEAMAEKYNANGKYPHSLVLDADGKVLKEWEGDPHLTPEQFVAEINHLNKNQ
jgi:thioredoxin-related protein